MAYPSVNFQPTSSFMGLQPINVASATQAQVLGTVIRARDVTYGEGEFIYLAGAASTAAGDAVCYNSKTGATVRALDGGSTSIGAFAIAMAATTAGLYGWYQISGSGPINAATAAANTVAYLSSTAGQIDDTGTTAISGLTLTAATSAGFATVQIDRPAVSAVSGSGNVTFASVGAVPNAAGGSASGTTITLQPADATHPGVVTTASQAFGGTKTFTEARAGKYGSVANAGNVQGLDLSNGANAYFRAASGGLLLFGVDGSDFITIGGLPGTINFGVVSTAKVVFASTDSSGTPGAATIDKSSGRSALAAGSGSAGVDFTSSCVSGATSKVLITPRAIDTDAPLFKAICASGKFTVTTYSTAGVATNVAGTWAFDWFVIN